MIQIDDTITAKDLEGGLADLFAVARRATANLRASWDPSRGTPVFTVEGAYTSRGWTEWTQGFVFGNAIYLYDADGDGDEQLLDYARSETVTKMASHVSHIGVHDHGFNNISTYGNLLRLMNEGRIDRNEWEAEFYRLAIKASGAVQASRWTPLPGDLGYVHSFNGPHSLFSDTIRSMRALAVAHSFGHALMGEQDEKISLLRRLLQHAEATSRFNVYFGSGRDAYDVRGRVVHESIFNTASGAYRCASTQQGYSPFSTWTRGLSWILCGYPEELEFLDTVSDEEIASLGLDYFPDKQSVVARFLETALAVADFFINETPTDGIPYWDTGAPGLSRLEGYLDRPSDPYNAEEPVDSSAAAISAQGLLRLGRYLVRIADSGDHSASGLGSGTDLKAAGERYIRAGLTVARSLFRDPYLAREAHHQGILLHSVYHRPNGWDHIRKGEKVPNGESCMWGDYHALELGVYIKRLIEEGPYLTFFNVGQ